MGSPATITYIRPLTDKRDSPEAGKRADRILRAIICVEVFEVGGDRGSFTPGRPWLAYRGPLAICGEVDSSLAVPIMRCRHRCSKPLALAMARFENLRQLANYSRYCRNRGGSGRISCGDTTAYLNPIPVQLSLAWVLVWKAKGVETFLRKHNRQTKQTNP